MKKWRMTAINPETDTSMVFGNVNTPDDMGPIPAIAGVLQNSQMQEKLEELYGGPISVSTDRPGQLVAKDSARVDVRNLKGGIIGSIEIELHFVSSGPSHD